MARRHRLIERWLTDVLGLDWSRAHDEAHRLEHALSPVVEERLAEQLGMPSTCPHGNPIPGMPAPEAHSPIPLSQAPAGHQFVVERITEEAEADRQLLRFLWESGDPAGQPHRGQRGRALRGHRLDRARRPHRHHGPGRLEQDLGLRPAWSPSPRARTRGARAHRARQVRAPDRNGGQALYALQNGFIGLRAERALLRRALRRAGGDPRHLLPDPDRRRDHPLRHRHLPARGARPACARIPSAASATRTCSCTGWTRSGSSPTTWTWWC